MGGGSGREKDPTPDPEDELWPPSWTQSASPDALAILTGIYALAREVRALRKVASWEIGNSLDNINDQLATGEAVESRQPDHFICDHGKLDDERVYAGGDVHGGQL